MIEKSGSIVVILIFLAKSLSRTLTRKQIGDLLRTFSVFIPPE